MGKDALEKADRIIMDAYINGISIISTGDNIVVKQRLRLFGEWIDNAYYLNERGFDYASNGCLKGIKEKKAKDDYIYDLNIKSTQKAMNDADRAFIQSEKSLSESRKSNWISWFALIVSVLAILLQLFEQKIKELF